MNFRSFSTREFDSNASHVERCAELIFLADDFNDKSFSRHQTLSLPVQSLVYLASESGVRHNVAARVKCECQTPSSLNAFSRCSVESIQDSVDKIQAFFHSFKQFTRSIRLNFTS